MPRLPERIGQLAAADAVSRLAVCALVREVTLTPKPGLVDTRSNGAHRDMDVTTFLVSAAALTPHFVACVHTGLSHGSHGAASVPGKGLGSLVDQLRVIGRMAEADMFAATGGINTHKGANFSMSLMLGATGLLLAQDATLPFSPADTQRMLGIVSRMGRLIIAQDFGSGASDAARRGAPPQDERLAQRETSHGEALFAASGVLGARGQAAAGYPVLTDTLMPYLRDRAREDVGDTLLRSLMLVMATLEDTNLLHRGGPEGLAWTRAQARAILADDPAREELVHRMRRLDREMTRRNLSPGGSADLLALGIFLASLEGLLD